MHELGTIMYVIRTVEGICEENNLTEVKSVTLEVGEVSGIIPHFLEDYWQYSIQNTRYLQKAELRIEEISAETYCEDCRKTYKTVKYAKQCPYCKGNHTYLLTGNEYNIREIEAC